MWNLIKMDFYRLFSSKTIKIAAFMSFLVCSVYMLLLFGLLEIIKISIQTDSTMADGIAVILPQVAWINGVNFSEIVISGTSVFSLFIGCMVSAYFIGSEQSAGYMKNYAGQLSNKGYTAISKFVVTAVAQFVVLVIYTIVSALFAMLFFNKYINGYDISALLAALGLRLMLYLAINSIIIFICTLTKSHAFAMVVGCIFGIGVTKFAYYMVSAVLSAVNINFSIADYMPDGINSQLALDTINDLAVKAILVSIIFASIFIVANYVLMRKRDVK